MHHTPLIGLPRLINLQNLHLDDKSSMDLKAIEEDKTCEPPFSVSEIDELYQNPSIHLFFHLLVQRNSKITVEQHSSYTRFSKRFL